MNVLVTGAIGFIGEALYSKLIKIVRLYRCFMFLRVDALKIVGLFNERYFEDFDLCRRIARKFSSIYYSNNEHRRNFKLFYYALIAAILYFNKWRGADEERLTLNEKVYSCISTCKDV